MTDIAQLSGLRVLVVEDEMMVSMLIEDMLADLGCTVVGPASRLDEAMELVKGAELDCAVLDVNLGGQPIFPLADLLRARGAPFAFATGYGDAGLRDVDRGTPVLQKPFREGDLARVLGELRAKGAKLDPNLSFAPDRAKPPMTGVRRSLECVE